MKIAVLVEYDGVGGTTYHYAEQDKASLIEQDLNESGLKYDRRDYASVYDFLSDCEEVCDGSFTDGEALEYVLDVINQLGV